MRTIYLAGPMENVTNTDAIGWREDVTRMLVGAGCTVLDPCRRIHDNDQKYMRRIFELDLRDIRESDIIIANLNDPKLAKHGTAIEVFYMAYVLQKPVVAFKSDSAVLHPFFESLVTEWRSTAEKAADTVISGYL